MFGPNPPAYSIPTSRRESSPEKPVPGPASYYIPRDPIPRSVSFNRARKHGHSKSEIPGPGSYTLNSHLGKAPHAIIISRKPQKSQTQFPGPADYTPRDSSQKIQYTMGSRSNSRIISAIPGPGAYESILISKASPRATIGKALRLNESSEITPGPGSYNPKDFKPAIPKFSFPMTPRSEGQYEKNPGPGAYNIDLSTNNGKPAVITPKRPLSAKNEKTPGPGSYNIDKDPYSVPKWTISKAKRGQSYTERFPSSADYTPKVNNYVPAYSIGNAKRTGIFSNVNVPGPGTYETGKESTAPKYTMSSKPEIASLNSVPGPGQYNNDGIAHKKKVPSAVFGTSKKLVNRPQTGPGPADYGIDRELKGPMFSFSRQKRNNKNTELVPGPGQYEIPHTIGTAKSSQSLNNTIT